MNKQKKIMNIVLGVFSHQRHRWDEEKEYYYIPREKNKDYKSTAKRQINAMEVLSLTSIGFLIFILLWVYILIECGV